MSIPSIATLPVDACMVPPSSPTSGAGVTLQAVIFGWAGTLVDFGSLAPARMLVESFARAGLAITQAQIGRPMHSSLDEHVAHLVYDPVLRAQWRERGQEVGEEQIKSIVDHFPVVQVERIGSYSPPIDGAADMLADLRAHGLKIGSCSGYPRRALETLRVAAQAAGIVTDHAVAGDDAQDDWPAGSDSLLASSMALGVDDVRACMKVDDSTAGIAAGRSAGMWCVGLSLSGSETGLPPERLLQMSEQQIHMRRERAEARLHESGAHLVVDSIAHLGAAVRQVEVWIAQGRRP